MELASVNWLAVVVSAVVAYVIGWIWYSPLLFSNIWMKLNGIKPDKKKMNGMGKTIFWSFVFTLVSMYVIAQFLIATGAGSYWDGVVVAFWLWLGLIVPVTLGSIFWDKKPFKLWMINAGHYLVANCVASGILAIWL